MSGKETTFVEGCATMAMVGDILEVIGGVFCEGCSASGGNLGDL